MTLPELLGELARRGHVSDEAMPEAERALAATSPKPPWFVSVLAGVGAWLGAFLLLMAVEELLGKLRLGQEGLQWVVVAALGLGGGLALLRRGRRVFVRQVGLALSLLGFLAAIIAATSGSRGIGAASLVALAVAIGLHVVTDDAVLRFVSVLSAALLILVWAVDDLPEAMEPGGIVLLLQVIGAGVLLGRPEAPRGAAPAGHALAVAALISALLLRLSALHLDPLAPWVVPAVTVALAGLVAWAARSVGGPAAREAAIAGVVGAVLIGLACLPAGPGLLVVVGLLVLGRLTGRRGLELLGALALPFVVVLHLFELDWTARQAGLALAVTGAVLLALRSVLARRTWASEGAP